MREIFDIEMSDILWLSHSPGQTCPSNAALRAPAVCMVVTAQLCAHGSYTTSPWARPLLLSLSTFLIERENMFLFLSLKWAVIKVWSCLITRYTHKDSLCVCRVFYHCGFQKTVYTWTKQQDNRWLYMISVCVCVWTLSMHVFQMCAVSEWASQAFSMLLLLCRELNRKSQSWLFYVVCYMPCVSQHLDRNK